MKPCPQFEKDNIGSRYAALKDRSILIKAESSLSDEELAFRNRLLEFEKHYFECDECLKRVREEQELNKGFQRLGELGFLRSEKESEKSVFTGWAAVAVSLLFISTSVLIVCVILLTHELHKMESNNFPRTVSEIVMLKPYVPLERSSGEVISIISSNDGPFLLGIDIREREVEISRFKARILDSSKQELWMDEDAHVDPSGKLFIQINRGFLLPGDYELEIAVINKQNGEEKNRVSYLFRVKS